MRKRSRQTSESFQMAPMIDMVFLLLVFFMTVSTLAREARPEIQLPFSGTAVIPASSPPRPVVTVLPSGGAFQVFWYNRKVEPDALESLLEKERDSGIILRGPEMLPWRAWESVLDPLRRGGATDAVFSTFEK